MIQTNHGGGLGRKVPPKSKKMTLGKGAHNPAEGGLCAGSKP